MACRKSMTRAERRKARNPDPRFACPCCDYVTLVHRYRYEICEICFWEDEHVLSDIEPSAANHGFNLKVARRNFRKIGACDPKMLPHVLPEDAQAAYAHCPRQS